MIINFPHKDYCSNILYNFINNIKQNKEMYLNNNSTNIRESIIDIKGDDKRHKFLLKCIEMSSNILTDKNDLFILSIFCNPNQILKWNICIFSDIVFNSPFTLDKIIFIPYNYLKKSCANNNYMKFSKTLIHEKIHVFQRFNLDLWNKIISTSFNEWFIINSKTELYNFLINYDFYKLRSINRVFNPDVVYNFIYLYKHNNNYHYGILHLIDGQISIKWYLIKKNNYSEKNNFSLIDLSVTDYLPDTEHPFEMFAYSFSDHLCD